MGAQGHRFSSVCLLVGLALCTASACGGAAGTPLDRPGVAPGGGGDDTSQGTPDTGGGSSSGGGTDATVADEPNPGDDMSFDATAGDGGDDVTSSSPDDAGPPPEASLCGPCMPGNRCCMVPGTVSYGQCYSVLCGPCCF